MSNEEVGKRDIKMHFRSCIWILDSVLNSTKSHIIIIYSEGISQSPSTKSRRAICCWCTRQEAQVNRKFSWAEGYFYRHFILCQTLVNEDWIKTNHHIAKQKNSLRSDVTLTFLSHSPSPLHVSLLPHLPLPITREVWFRDYTWKFKILHVRFLLPLPGIFFILKEDTGEG